MNSEIIASRGFTNDDREELNFFIKKDGIDTLLIIEHDKPKSEQGLIMTMRISPEVLKELSIMFNFASKDVEKDSNVDPLAFRNY